MPSSKLKEVSELAAIRDKLAAENRRLVFTNGCFDLLHVGHVRYLQAARDFGHALLVAVNGDTSVHALKGPGRPINKEADRAEVVAALASVDYVTIFQAERVTDLVRKIRPHVYAKGGDYSIDTLDAEEVAALRKVGADIRIVPLVTGKSTTAIIEKMSALGTSS